MELIKYPQKKDWDRILKRPVIEDSQLERITSKIIEDVRLNGDAALKKFSLKFDKTELTTIQVEEEDFLLAEKFITPKLKGAILLAKHNIEQFHRSQKEEVKIIETVDGVKCWRKSIGIEKVGLYIPGGSAPLFSTLLMLGIPSKLAGCKEIIVCTPPDKNGKIDPVILYTAKIIGIEKVFKIGGAQAIAAMAFGTETIPQVYKIFGPGNQFVTSAKQLIAAKGIAIDMPAGPSELAILADNSANASFIAADLLSQAEHGSDSQVILVSNQQELLQKVDQEIKMQLDKLPRKDIAQQALQNSKLILVKDLMEGIELLNEYAPEHLIIACENYGTISEKIINAGSVFLGNFSCESAGDYASGTNHTLPTNGSAKAYSGLSLDSFVKKITFQELNKTGLINLGREIETMAEAEGLMAHKNAVSIRLIK